MKKILFLIHDLGHGGAEKVLVNLVNNMDRTKFDITVMAMFGGGVNEQFLSKDIHYKTVFKKMIPGNSHLMKLLSPERLHKWFIKEHYDIEVAYLEGPSVRVISGCKDKSTKLVSWIHVEQHNMEKVAASFRSDKEAVECYQKFHRTICVSETVKQDFTGIVPLNNPVEVLYNTNETAQILALSKENVEGEVFSKDDIKLVGVGKIVSNKGFDRLARIHKRLVNEGYPVHTYILGEGNKKEELEKYLAEENIADSFTFLGYQTNPYKYVSKCDLFVCSSFAEGFSTAATEALIVGTPVVTTEVSGMKEMLGDNDEWGIVTDNNEEALYKGIKKLLDDKNLLAHYKEKAAERGKTFSTENTVKAVEQMLMSL